MSAPELPEWLEESGTTTYDEFGQEAEQPFDEYAEERGIEARSLQDVEDIDTGDYPQAAVENARMALEAREDTGNPNDCGTQVGWERANQLDNGEDLSEETINRMAQFERHEDNYDPDAERSDCGWMMYKAWGGEEGIEWAQDKVEEFEEAREMSGENWYPEDGEAWETAMYETWDHQLASDETDRKLFGFSSSDTPEFVFDRIRDAINSGVLFSQIDAIDSGDRMELQTLLKDSLTDDGWTITELSEEIQEFADISAGRAETIARTETAGILNTARESGYEAQGQLEGSKFYWTNPMDNRTTDACEWLVSKTNPFRGGEPRPLDELREMVEEAPTHDDDMPNDLARKDDWVVHPRERSTWARAPGE